MLGFGFIESSVPGLSVCVFEGEGPDKPKNRLMDDAELVDKDTRDATDADRLTGLVVSLLAWREPELLRNPGIKRRGGDPKRRGRN